MSIDTDIYSTRAMGRREFAACAGLAIITGGALAASYVLASEGMGPGDGHTPPDRPEGGMGPGGGQTPPDMPGGGMGPGGFGGGADTMSFDYTGTYTGAIEADGVEATSASESIEATLTDQNVALACNGGTLIISGDSLAKSGDDSDGDRCNFYGCNSIALAVNEGSSILIDSSTLSATSEGSNGIFSTDGACVFANAVSITTTADNSRGLDATYGGSIIAHDVDIQTQGDHCAGIANDRGGGFISVTDSTIATAGSGSPVLYSTGCIEVSGVTGVATGSQIAGMEGLNTIVVANSSLESAITGATASDPIANGVIIYQSMSGDAEAATGERATFQVVGSTLKSAIASGAMFYITNTSADVVLADNVIDFDAGAADLARVAGNAANNWGSPGSNGASCNFTALRQELAGDVVADTISTLNLYLLGGSVWRGSASIEANAYGSTSQAPLNVFVDATSTWVVTADATISTLAVEPGGAVVDADGSPLTIVAGGAAVTQGSSALTLTVEGAYSTELQTSEANELKSAESLIDRSAFDALYGLDTSFSLA